MTYVNSVVVSPKEITIKYGSWYDSVYAAVSPLNADNRKLVWSSENSSIAGVNTASGGISGNGVGTTRVFATAADGSGCSDYLIVNVEHAVLIDSLNLDRSDALIEVGESITLNPIISPDNATTKDLNWISSSPSVATVNNGVVTGVSEGSTRITARTKDGSSLYAYCDIDVTTDTIVRSIDINPSNITLAEGETMFLNETVSPSNATNRSVRWRSSNPSVATVHKTSGLVRAQNEGSATIYATAEDGSEVYGTCSVVVSYGEYVDIPQNGNIGTSILYTGYHTITEASNQYSLKIHSRNNNRYSISNPDYYSLIDGRIVIATKQNIGNLLQVAVGDYVQVRFSCADGSLKEYSCIIGEIKGDDAPNIWGHNDGRNVVEIVYHDYNPPIGFIPLRNDPWGSGRVIRITKVGSYGNYA